MRKSLHLLRQALQQHSLDAFLVTDDVNIRYLTDYPSQESWLLVLPQRCFYLTDRRYSLDARHNLSDAIVMECRQGIGQSLRELALKQSIRVLGFDKRHLTLATFDQLKSALGARTKLKGVQDLIEPLRAIKSPGEIACIQKALCFHLQCYKHLQGIITPGYSERQILAKLEEYLLRHQRRFSFAPIIASGPHSCLPHARVTDRKIQKNDIVLVDMGIEEQGYKSDLTRMFFLGKIPRLVKEVFAFVQEAQQLAIKQIKPGVLASDIDRSARNFLKNNKLDIYFSHSLGHGIGLEVHEAPGLSPKSSAILQEGMVVTVEPGVYLPGKFGIRIEDMVLVTKKGSKCLSEMG